MFFVLSQEKLKTGQKPDSVIALNLPSKKNPTDPRRALFTIPPLKIPVQTVALLPNSGPRVSNYLFRLKTHPGPNTVLFFTIRSADICLVHPRYEAPVFYPLWPGCFPVLPQGKAKRQSSV
jgi:hypothetical protein